MKNTYPKSEYSITNQKYQTFTEEIHIENEFNNSMVQLQKSLSHIINAVNLIKEDYETYAPKCRDEIVEDSKSMQMVFKQMVERAIMYSSANVIQN